MDCFNKVSQTLMSWWSEKPNQAHMYMIIIYECIKHTLFWMYVKRNYKDDKDMFQTTLENVEMAKQSLKNRWYGHLIFFILNV